MYQEVSIQRGILCLVIPPSLINCLPQQLLKKSLTIPTLHLLIQLTNKPSPQKTLTIIQKPRRDIVPLIPPIALSGSHPMRRRIPSLKPNIVSNSFY
ncbi:hypothetical protein Sjap_022789 [Stephania japonica]|uniref:Uncharacterized protein n=1 Tax=Stephania japonica TaxID=461633 RepID=A0AAP0EUX9_9MAGN